MYICRCSCYTFYKTFKDTKTNYTKKEWQISNENILNSVMSFGKGTPRLGGRDLDDFPDFVRRRPQNRLRCNYKKVAIP